LHLSAALLLWAALLQGRYTPSKKMGKKLNLIVGIDPNKYEIGDPRLRKPIWHQKKLDGKIVGSGLFQELDEIKIDKKKLIYFQPNNIGVLLSISKKHLEMAKDYFAEHFKNPATINFEHYDGDRKKFISERSKEVCDYIEMIETTIVFSYSAIEAFANISIPNDFIYNFKNSRNGIEESYDKEAIERWITLKEKISVLLPNIFNVKKPTQKKWWGDFIKLENYRHNIIHQKSIDGTEFYKKYFLIDIFRICDTAETIIKYFYDETAKQNKTHIMWPWLKKEISEIPISFVSGNINAEVVGNLYEGIKKKGV